MSGLHSFLRKDVHAYTRSKTPWILSEHTSAYGKLIHYLSGGGMRTFGRTVGQEEARRKHIRFYIIAGILGAFWLALSVL